MYYLNNGHLVHDLKNEMDQISDIRSPKGVFDQQIVADRFDMNDDACRRVNMFFHACLRVYFFHCCLNFVTPSGI